MVHLGAVMVKHIGSAHLRRARSRLYTVPHGPKRQILLTQTVSKTPNTQIVRGLSSKRPKLKGTPHTFKILPKYKLTRARQSCDETTAALPFASHQVHSNCFVNVKAVSRIKETLFVSVPIAPSA